ncbi:hypothetical protein Cgig2_002980 [Carnegiea gigantea]|uniref:Ribosomal RNA methyltransferase FtsJ domain-containing protein n=1 Tax=Carnegiea gigantea TaxID=171969 RepID=A0A9Q1K606_9CARY|nr:hypothetical protein Cgig2_002980 [Carnegiea gigantea]
MGKASRDKRDIYYRKAKEEGWRARSAFKLLQIDEEFNIFEGACNLPRNTDLPLIVAVDLQPMAPIEGVIQVQGDITNARTAEVVIRHFDGCKAELVVCDGAPDVTGLHDMDEFVQSQLILALKIFFPKVTFAKPKSSRNSSIGRWPFAHNYFAEAFAVCEDYCPPAGFNEKDLYRLLKEVGSPSGTDDLVFMFYSFPIDIDVKGLANFLSVKSSNSDCSSGWLEGPNKVYIPFLACGDLGGYDSDRSYPLPQVAEGTYKSLDPVQPPIAPPYKRALELKKAASQGIQQLEKRFLDS